MSRISCSVCKQPNIRIKVHPNAMAAAAAAAAALWLFVETPSLFYPNMSCHHNNRIVDFCPCLKHTTNRFTRTYARIHIMYVTMTTAVITCYYRHPRFRPPVAAAVIIIIVVVIVAVAVTTNNTRSDTKNHTTNHRRKYDMTHTRIWQKNCYDWENELSDMGFDHIKTNLCKRCTLC